MKNRTRQDRISVELVKITGKYQVERATGPYCHAGIIDTALTLLVNHLNDMDNAQSNASSSYNGKAKIIEKYFRDLHHDCIDTASHIYDLLLHEGKSRQRTRWIMRSIGISHNMIFKVENARER